MIKILNDIIFINHRYFEKVDVLLNEWDNIKSSLVNRKHLYYRNILKKIDINELIRKINNHMHRPVIDIYSKETITHENEQRMLLETGHMSNLYTDGKIVNVNKIPYCTFIISDILESNIVPREVYIGSIDGQIKIIIKSNTIEEYIMHMAYQYKTIHQKVDLQKSIYQYLGHKDFCRITRITQFHKWLVDKVGGDIMFEIMSYLCYCKYDLYDLKRYLHYKTQ